MREIIIKRKKSWIVFNDKELKNKPFARVITYDNKEEYSLGITILFNKFYAIDEDVLVEKITEIKEYKLSAFMKQYAPK